MLYRKRALWACFIFLFFGCSEEAPELSIPADAASLSGDATPENAQASGGESATDEKSEENSETSSGKNSPASSVPDNSPVPTEAECNKALESMTVFAEKIGQKPPKKKESNEFLVECAEWPRKAVQCLGTAKEAPKVIECMKPIAESEMRRGLKKVKATHPSIAKPLDTDRSLAPKKVKASGGAAARRMESFKKAVGKE